MLDCMGLGGRGRDPGDFMREPSMLGGGGAVDGRPPKVDGRSAGVLGSGRLASSGGRVDGGSGGRLWETLAGGGGCTPLLMDDLKLGFSWAGGGGGAAALVGPFVTTLLLLLSLLVTTGGHFLPGAGLVRLGRLLGAEKPPLLLLLTDPPRRREGMRTFSMSHSLRAIIEGSPGLLPVVRNLGMPPAKRPPSPGGA